MNNNNSILLVDCGNTYIKWCLLAANGQLSEQQREYHKDKSVLATYKAIIDAQSANCHTVVMVSVLGDIFSAGANKITQEAELTFLEAHSQTPYSTVRNGYQNPENLGNDRLVAMIGAGELVDTAYIVIDSGTATTIDAVDENKHHLGGVIFPGLELSLRSLFNDTQQLPKLEGESQKIIPNGLATDTDEAISSGCLLSLASAIEGICNKMQHQLRVQSNNNELTVKRILCGGAAKSLLSHLPDTYIYQDNLVMLGLKKIQEVSIQNDK